MSSLVIRNIHTLATVDDDYRVLHDVDVLVEGDKIRSIGKDLAAPADALTNFTARWVDLPAAAVSGMRSSA